MGKAKVIDIRMHTPLRGEDILVDSNVLLPLVYGNFINMKGQIPDYKNHYLPYINKADSIGAILRTTSFNILEVIHTIRKEEVKLAGYKLENGHPNPIAYKDKDLVNKIHEEIKTSFNNIGKFLGSIIENDIDVQCICGVHRLCLEMLDSYDAAVVHTMLTSGVARILTQDEDFSRVGELTVLTANKKIIAAAERENRLILA